MKLKLGAILSTLALCTVMGTYILTESKTTCEQKGIYVRIDSNQIYSIGISKDKESGGLSNADGSCMKSSDLINLNEAIGENEDFQLTAYNQDHEVIVTKYYKAIDTNQKMIITINEEGLLQEQIL